jgi:hypothetical protein
MKGSRQKKVLNNSVEVKKEKLEKSVSRSKDKIGQVEAAVKISELMSEGCEK